MPERPVIHVTNWSSRRLHGPGRKWTIMVRPRYFERGEGYVRALMPSALDLEDVKADVIGLAEYRDRFLETRRGEDLGPFGLLACAPLGPGFQIVNVRDGDTLCCSCSREAAAQGKCHRSWSAELLRRAGWRVILDGRPLAGVDADWRPVWEAPHA